MMDETGEDGNAGTKDEDASVKPSAHGILRRIMAWVMILLFTLLVANILFFHVMMGETAILYIALVAVFFLGNGMRGGARQYDGQKRGERGEPDESAEPGESDESSERGEPDDPVVKKKQANGNQHRGGCDSGKN